MPTSAAPASETLVTSQLDHVVAALARDDQSGAVEVADRAAALIMQFCDNWHGDDSQFQSELIVLCRKLIAARAGTAALLNLCNDVVQASERPGVIFIAGRPQNITRPQSASNAALKFTAFLAHHARRIANELLPYIHSGSLLVTHSYSATVLAALLRAQNAGKRFAVVCTEARPRFEGLRMARALAEHGIAVEVIIDGAAAVFIHGFYMLLIGADAIGPEGVVNKVGTLGMALAARRHGVPVYCLAGSEKYLPCGAQFALVEQAGDEVVAPIANLRGFNLYFDQTPLDLVTRFFTEDRVLSSSELPDHLRAHVLHPALHADA